MMTPSQSSGDESSGALEQSLAEHTAHVLGENDARRPK